MAAKLVFQNLKRNINPLISILLFLTGFTVNILYAGIGYMPLDQSIVFDGAWRILQGQTPYTDFYLPNGLVPIYLQSLFFIILKPSYLAYCLHSSIFNGLFAILSYFFLLPLLKNKTLSFLYSCATSFLFYPPMGTPYYDQHSFFFMLVTWLTIYQLKPAISKNKALILGVMTSIFYAAALLSKQVPAIFLIPILIWILIRKYIQYNKITLVFLVGSFVAGIVILISFFLTLNVTTFQKYAIELPSTIGQVRTLELIDQPTKLITISLDAFDYLRLNFITRIFHLNLFFFTLCVISNAYYCLKPKTNSSFNQYLRRFSPNIKLATLSMTLLMICFFYNAYTNNEASNGIPFIFLSLGLLHKVGLNGIRLIPKTLSKVYKKKESILRLVHVIRRIGPIIFGISIIYFLLNSTLRFDRAVNKTRITSNIFYISQGPLLSPMSPLSFLKMENGFTDHVRTDELNEVMEYFTKNKGNFFLFGDSSILYGATGRPSIFPSLWFHPGLTYPEKQSGEFDEYESRLLSYIDSYKVDYFVLEGEKTFMNARIEDFPKVNHYFRENYCLNQSIGKFQIYTHCNQ